MPTRLDGVPATRPGGPSRLERGREAIAGQLADRTVAAAAVVGVAALAGAASVVNPLLAIGVGLAALFGTVFAARPETGTLAVVAVLFSNAAVVAVRFHGVPGWAAGLVPMMLLVPLAHLVLVRRQPLIVDRPVVWMAGFLIAQMLSTAFAREPDLATASLATFAVEGLGLYLLVTNVVRTVDALRRAAWVLVIVGALLGGLSFYQDITRTFGNDYGGFAQMSDAAFDSASGEKDATRRHAGPVGSQNRWAQCLAMLAPLALALAVGTRERWRRPAAILALGGVLLGIAMTYSRGVVVGLVLTLLLALALRWVRMSSVAAGVLVTVVAVSLVVPAFLDRASTVVTAGSATAETPSAAEGADGSFQSRFTENLAAIQTFVDHPVIGVGPGLFPTYYQPYARKIGIRVVGVNREAHSLYLSLAAETGVLGLVTFAGVVGATLAPLVRARRRSVGVRPDLTRLTTGFALAVVAYLATGLFLHFAYIRYFWLMMALAAAAGRIASRELAPTAPPTVVLRPRQ